MEEIGGCCEGNAGGDGRAMMGDGNTLSLECEERNGRLKDNFFLNDDGRGISMGCIGKIRIDTKKNR
jgi:hypothetical protein